MQKRAKEEPVVGMQENKGKRRAAIGIESNECGSHPLHTLNISSGKTRRSSRVLIECRKGESRTVV
jgi:hypothetical protein